MNAPDVLKYGHSWFLKAIDKVPDRFWDKPGATGTWSPKNILSHITSYELILVEILKEFVDSGKSIKNPIEDHQKFNDTETSKRKDLSWQEVLEEYNSAHDQVAELIGQIP